MRIDSHHHVWDLSAREQGWMVGDALNPIKKNFSINDLRQAITGCGIQKTVVVQTVTNYDETPELLELADTDDLVANEYGKNGMIAHPSAHPQHMNVLNTLHMYEVEVRTFPCGFGASLTSFVAKL